MSNAITLNPAQILMSKIDNPELVFSVVEKYEACKEKRTADDGRKQPFLQKTETLPVAHMRCCLKLLKKHEQFHDHKTWGDVAHSSTFGFSKLELRLAIIAMGIENVGLNERGTPTKISQYYRGEICGEEV